MCDQFAGRFLSRSFKYRFKSSISDLDKHVDNDDNDDDPDVSAFICCLICDDNTNISNGLKSFILNGNVSTALVIFPVLLVARDIRLIIMDNAKTSFSVRS